MQSLILRTAIRYVFPLLGLMATFLLLRGHNEPGGGFVAGVTAAIGIMLAAYAYDAELARTVLRFDPRGVIAVGLLLVAASGMWGWTQGKPFLSGEWIELDLHADVGTLHLGTPLIFDLGVFFVVLGTIVLALVDLLERNL